MLSNVFRQVVRPRRYPALMPEERGTTPIDPVRVAVGQRLAGARELLNLTQEQVAGRFGVNKATVSAWETGRGDPGVYRLRELSKLYKVSTDALLWADAPSVEGMQMAAQYDSLTEKQRSTLKALWLAYITESATDEDVEQGMPITQAAKEPK